MEEARRLASLQKKRELKAAGIEMREMKRRSRGINYNNEVAFEKRPAPGFYDVGEEQQMTKEMGQEFRPVTLEEMEGKRRKVAPAILELFKMQGHDIDVSDCLGTLLFPHTLKASLFLDHVRML